MEFGNCFPCLKHIKPQLLSFKIFKPRNARYIDNIYIIFLIKISVKPIRLSFYPIIRRLFIIRRFFTGKHLPVYQHQNFHCSASSFFLRDPTAIAAAKAMLPPRTPPPRAALSSDVYKRQLLFWQIFGGKRNPDFVKGLPEFAGNSVCLCRQRRSGKSGKCSSKRGKCWIFVRRGAEQKNCGSPIYDFPIRMLRKLSLQRNGCLLYTSMCIRDSNRMLAERAFYCWK